MSGVLRVETETGSHVEPPLDQNASPLEKLLWHAAVLEADTGAVVRISRGRRGYSLTGDGWSISEMTFADCWTYINGISTGIRLALGP